MRISDWSSDVCSSDLSVGCVNLDRSECAFKSRRIKGLLILTPSDRSHEALVIQVDALTPHRDDRAFNTSILQMKTVKLNILRVGNGGKVCLSVCGTVVILNGVKCPLNLSQNGDVFRQSNFKPSPEDRKSD